MATKKNHMVKALSSLSVNQNARVRSISDSCLPYVRKRLCALGFCNAHCVTVIRKAPLGCPIEVEILDTRVMLRKTEAEHIIIEKV